MERYEAYKHSGVDWIGEIPEGWELRKLKLLGSTRSGMGNKKPDDFGTGRPFLSYKDVYSRESFTSATGLVESTSDDLERYSVFRGDAFFTGSSETIEELGFSSVCLATIPEATFNGFTIRFRPYGGDLHPEFAAYLFRSDVFRGYLRQRDNSITRANLSQQILGDALAVLPTLDEQFCIAGYLDAKTAEIDALVTDCEREVDLLQEYRKAVLSEAVTKGLDPDAPMKDSGIEWIGEIPDDWEVVGFKTYLNGIIDYRGRTPEKVDDGVFLITGRNIKQGRIHYELSQEYMRPEDFDKIMGRGRLKVGNVLFTMEAPLGEVALIDRDDCAAAQRIIQLCCNEEELLGAFLVYWIMSDEFQSDLQTYATGSTASGIKASKLGMLRLIHPPMETQHSIVDYLDTKTAEIDALIDAKRSMADKLREYRRSLISEAVTGKFKVPGV